MSRSFALRAASAMIVSLFLSGTVGGCVLGAKLREDAQLITKKVASARERGAYRCAAPELARAEANLEFLDYELSQGDFRRAQRHHDVALASVNRALEVTDPDKCADKRVTIREDQPIIITKTDRDGDGVPDAVDQCPDEPEDRDQFEDDNGCPDPDNDGDTVLDIVDQCPLEPGDVKNNGCPLADRDGDGVGDANDQCPDTPEDKDGHDDQDGCPEQESLDSDGDGLLDSVDKCPNDPEDRDQFQDEDGCPDPDNDMDTVLDSVDTCPNDPGPPGNNGCPVVDRDGDGITDDIDQCPDVPGSPPNGCPKQVLVVKTDTKIEIKKQIMFESNKAKIIGGVSFEIMKQVAAVLKSNPHLKVVIEGHTDSVGAADYNLRLSDSRAHSVRESVIADGIEAGRLEAIGYGESRPMASNKTKTGRAANRRVEFVIVQDEGKKN